MHIVEIPSFFIPYGGEFCLEQSKTLAALGHNVTIIANVQLAVRRGLEDYLFSPFKSQDFIVDGIRVVRSEMRGIPIVVRPNVYRWISGVKRMFRKYVSENGVPDIIHAHSSKWAGYAAAQIAEEFNIPFVITEHLSSMIFEKEFKKNHFGGVWQIPLLKKAYMSADMVIPVSAELVKDLAPYFGESYRWTEISNTIDTGFYTFKERSPLNNRKFRICCLGNFDPRKGYDVLFKAFSQFHQQHPDSELLIAGVDTDSDKCKRLINTFSCASSIIAYGKLDKTEVRDLLYKCDCLALATRSEAQGLVLLEAMSTGIPVVTTDCVPQNVRVEGGCYIVPVDDADGMCRMISRIFTDGRVDGRDLSDKISRLVSPEVIGKKIETVFKDVLKSKL